MGKLKDGLKLLVGRAAELTRPDLGREIDAARNPTRAPALKRAILHARLRRAQSAGDIAAIETALAAFWKGGSGDQFHDRFVEERFNLFREHHAVVIDELARLVAQPGGGWTRLVEIGCGDGNVLAYTADRLSGLTEAVGLDINAAVIARNSTERAAGGRLSFAVGDAAAWLAANPKPGTVVLSNGGVLEYLAEPNFDRLLNTLAEAAPAAIALIEPVAPAHDLPSQPDSFAFGHEHSFSHNHRVRLAKAGFDVVFALEKPLGGVRWMLMVGVIA